MLNGPYVVINQLIKSIWKNFHFKNFFIIHVTGKKLSVQQKMTKIGSFENKVQMWLFESP
jgi:hypothetical protein